MSTALVIGAALLVFAVLVVLDVAMLIREVVADRPAPVRSRRDLRVCPIVPARRSSRS